MGEWTWTQQKEQAALLIAEDRLIDEEICEKIGVRSRETLRNWRREPSFQGRVNAHVDAFRAAVRSRGIACLERRVDAVNDRWLRMRRIIDERAADPELQGIPGGGTGLLVRQGKLVKVYEPLKAGEEITFNDGDPCPSCFDEDEGCVSRLHTATVTDLGTGDVREALVCRLCCERWRQELSDTLVSARRTEIVWEYAVDAGLLRELREHEKQAAQELGQWTERQDVTLDGAVTQIVVNEPARRADPGTADTVGDAGTELPLGPVPGLPE